MSIPTKPWPSRICPNCASPVPEGVNKCALCGYPKKLSRWKDAPSISSVVIFGLFGIPALIGLLLSLAGIFLYPRVTDFQDLIFCLAIVAVTLWLVIRSWKR